MTSSLKPLIIVGSGLAGVSVAKEFRKLNPSTPLLIMTQDDGHFYSKPQLSLAMAQQKSPSTLIITDKNTLQTQLNATIITHSTLKSIDAQNHCIEIVANNQVECFDYQQLVLAMGAHPKTLPDLQDLDLHFRINNRLDYQHFIDSSQSWQHLTILGSGLVGCEFAFDFSHRFEKIDVISPEPTALSRWLPAFFGEQLQRKLTERNIVWHNLTSIQSIRKNSSKLDIVLSSNQNLQTNGLLSAIGLDPNPLHNIEHHLKINQGIVVNSFLQTSLPNIYALGDCMEFNNQCRQFVAPILQCARSLAQTLNGRATAPHLPATPIALKVDAYPITFMPPPTHCQGHWQLTTEQHSGKAIFYDHKQKMRGYALSGLFLEERQFLLKQFHEAQKQEAEV